MGIGVSLILIAAGAILTWAVNATVSGVDINAVGVILMVVGAIGFYRRDLPLLFVALGLMGVHSTLFGPVKYAILPQHLRNDELVGGNGLVEMGTFVAILLGEIVGGPSESSSGPTRNFHTE